MTPPLRILITGGGTGGHVYPGLAVAEALQDLAPAAEIRFAGTKGGLEAVLVPEAGYRLCTVPASGLRGLGHRARLLFVVNFLRGFARSLGLMTGWRPSAVLGTGGFVSAPVMAAARVLAVPCALQEQNAIPGSTNRLVGRWARRIYLGFGPAASYFGAARCRLTGNPVRAAFVGATRNVGAGELDDFGVPGRRVLVFGGSRGARTINRALASGGVPDGAACLVQTGEADHATVQEAIASDEVRVVPYIRQMAAALLWADLVVCRAGAMTLAELGVVGRAAILVPFPHATDNHQWHNARDIEKAGAALVLDDAECDGPRLRALISNLLADSERLRSMAAAAATLGQPEAAGQIARDLLEMVGHPAGQRYTTTS